MLKYLTWHKCMHTQPVVWFFDPSKTPFDLQNAINKLVANWDPPFCHTEIQFSSGEAFSIVVNGKVRKRLRTFDTQYYQGFKLNCSLEQCNRAWNVACQEFEAEKKFGLWGRDTTFCSKLVGTILHQSGICTFDNVTELNTLSPSMLYKKISLCASPLNPNALSAIDFKSNVPDNSI